MCRLPRCLGTAVILLGLLAQGSASVVDQYPDAGGALANTTENANWTVLVTLNSGMYITWNNWLMWYRRLGSPYRVQVFAEDGRVFDRLRKDNFPEVTVTAPVKDNGDTVAAAAWGSAGFNRLVTRRAGHILQVLREGKRIIYSDLDTIWLHDPVPYFRAPYDMWAQVERDVYPKEPQWRPFYCSGIIAALPTPNAIAVMEAWDKQMATQSALLDDQVPFNDVLHRREHVAAIDALPPHRFPNGLVYFYKEGAPRIVARARNTHGQYDRSQAVIIHNNHAQGKGKQEDKIMRLKRHGLWLVPDAGAADSAH
eukprot:TRINITY_DN688_c0_g1_i3.p1 TRINITY_DN688_c0_g1~~TRINITY_DN688_c0_g1_i3.p1  ORF type:complete len:311 (+),score=83.77 TRINITY_DN688_c0_g1_i3:102-1034(+)